MPYHLKYTALVLSWWGATYWGLHVSRFGPIRDVLGIAIRAGAGVALLIVVASALLLADGVRDWGPWPSYYALSAGYAGMAVVDVILHDRQLAPPWLLKWKLCLNVVIFLSLLFGVVKGKYLERNA